MSIKKNAYGFYEFDERIHGKRFRESLHTKVYAVARMEAEKVRQRHGLLSDRRLRVKHLVAEVLADSRERNSESHLQGQGYVLGLFVEAYGDRFIDELQPAECNQYALSLKTKMVEKEVDGKKTKVKVTRSPERVNAHLRILKAAFGFAVRMRYVGTNPFAPVKRLTIDARPPRTLTIKEYQKVLAQVRAYDPDMGDLVETLTITGMRRSEALLLMGWENVWWEKGYIELIGTKGHQRNRRKYRYLPLTPRVRAILERRKALGEPYPWMKRDHNFTKHVRRVRILPDHLTQMFSRLSKAAGVDDVTLHDLRRTFATMLAERGLQENLLIKATGHASGAVTDQFYIGPALQVIGAAIAEVEAVLSAA